MDASKIDTTISRRQALQTLTTAAAVTLVPRYVLGGSGYTAPSDKLNIAMIGTGGQGMWNLKNILPNKDVQVIALADVAEEADYSWSYHKESGGRKPGYEVIRNHYLSSPQTADYPDCRVYVDFREMLDKEKAIDAVCIAIPDHTHYVAAMAALQRGKHIYLEKPLARTIYEVRRLTEAARAAGVVTQMGIQGHSGEGIRLTVEWLRAGAIGAVREIHAWSDGVSKGACLEGEPEPQPIPAGLDWNLWLGPAKYRPYNSCYTPGRWRTFWDFGTGHMTDMGIHHMDPAFWALDLGYPEWTEARGAWGDRDKRPFAALHFFHFAAKDDRPAVDLTWYSGLKPPRPDELEPGRDLIGNGNGILFIGDKGKIMCEGWGGAPHFIPESRLRDFERPPKTLPRVKGGHHRDWIDAIKEGRKACADFDYSGPITESILMGIVALRIGERLYWDGPNMKALNCPDAEQYIVPEYHNGWTL
ncbi:MAG: Gfo/Idh/MocA family oxidoreductase [candidate division KSB1 bacterium]|nr:Gfo/Idh/MocA family oxidoreductase [candidate division KSB1 bacterium]